jgi:Spy/CpxP family protein refolding chaperone
MIKKIRLTVKSVAISAAVLLAFTAFSQASAQTAEAQGDPGKQHKRGGGRGNRDYGMQFRHLMQELNLSETQKQQVTAILKKYEESTRAQREQLKELRKSQGAQPGAANPQADALKAQLKESAKSMREEIKAILTPEQQKKAEELEQRFKGGRGGHKRHDKTGPQT